MTRTLLWAGLALLPLVAWPQDGGKPQYISDDISVSLRDAPRNDAAVIGAISSGARVSLLESLGDQSFARVRTADGRSGWLNSRYLTAQPAAKDRLTELQTQLTQSRDHARDLQAQLDGTQAKLDKARPALETADENDRLRDQLTAARASIEAAASSLDEERARRRTLVTGAALVGGGVLIGLLLPWLGSSGRRRRRSDF